MTNFFFCHFAGVRIGMKMQHIQFQAAFCHRIARNGAVNSARKHGKPFSRAADGHSVRTKNCFGVDKSFSVFAKIDVNGKIGIEKIHGEGMFFFEYSSAYFTADLH